MPRTAAVLAYPFSNNLGDYIQSIAAKQWIQTQEVLALDREELHTYSGPKVNLIMNGWFMEDGSHWPPSSQIRPLFLSFHLNPTAQKAMLTPEGIAYFKKHQPIGCRDRHTERIMIDLGIQAYFSGCLTLGLNRSSFVSLNKQRKGIVVISPLERLLPEKKDFRWTKKKPFLHVLIQLLKYPIKQIKYKQAIKRVHQFLEVQDEEVTWHSQLIDTENHSEEHRIQAAIKQLHILANAKLVITSRIHSALPAVAFETPVLFLSDGLEHPNQKSRLEGMETFFPILNSRELYKWKKTFPKARNKHLPLVGHFKKEIHLFLKD